MTVTFASETHGLRYTLKVNPSLSDYLEGQNLKDAIAVIKRIKVKSKSAATALGVAIAKLKGSQAISSRRDGARAAILAAGGFEALLKAESGSLEPLSTTNQGVELEDAIKEALSARAEDHDSLVHRAGPTGPGVDSLMINTQTREVTALEIKLDGQTVLHGRETTRPVPPHAIAHAPMQGTDGFGRRGPTLGQQHLGIGPGGVIADPVETSRRADQIVAGTPVALPGRVMENKLSGVTQNLTKNLTKHADNLEADIEAAMATLGDLDMDARRKTEMALKKQKLALQVLRDVINGTLGTLHIVLAESESAPPTNAYSIDADARRVAEQLVLLDAGRRNFLASQQEANVNVDIAIVEMDEEGNIVQTRETR